MALLFQSTFDRPDWWADELSARIAGLDLRLWPEAGPPEDIEFALVWKPPPGMLSQFPNLKAIFSIGAGVDHIFADPELPPDVPITRVVDDRLTAGIVEYVLLMVLRAFRRLPDYADQQDRGEWRQRAQRQAFEESIGLLGLGVLGRAAAAQLLGLGFNVLGWSRTPKPPEFLPGVETFAGPEGLTAMLGRSRILVCLLPLTAATENILDARAFAALPKGATVINAARGGHVAEADLIAALDDGHLAGAVLDVFRTEPLPAGHSFWTHPKITVTPHVASVTDPRSVADQVAENIRRVRDGRPLLHLIDRRQGY